ncbi:Cysteine-rich receptor-like protein kinase 26, partial [Mucuna pruriens]
MVIILRITRMFLFNINCVTPLLLLSLFGSLTWSTSATPNFNDIYCPNNATYDSNTTFQTNLNVLLSTLVSNATQGVDSYTTIMGFGSTNAVNGLFLCRADLSSATCHDCVATAAVEITRRCPNQTESIIWYDECMVRYTNRYFGPTSIVPRANLWSDKNISASDLRSFNQTLFGLLSRLATEAAGSQAADKFATGEGTFTASASSHVYGLAQCGPGMTNAQCEACLVNASRTLASCCEGKQGARALLAWCNIRYELYQFYNTTGTSSPLPSPPPGKKKSGSRRTVMIVVLVVVSVILFCSVCYFLLRRSRKNYRTLLRENFGDESATLESLQFNLATIEVATKKFSYENKIGKGGFGEVYKGILTDGRQIAVKKLSHSSGQDRHKTKLLSWPERYKIIEGIAQGILYLHDHSRLKVIHRDLKPSNVLLDNNMNPKISDFGLARMIALEQDRGSTKRIVGTYGYMSPEYAMHGQFSEKSDVFSFGVIVLEIISSKRNARSLLSDNIDDLLSNAWRQWRDETPLKILDQNIEESCYHDDVVKCIQIGLLCVQDKPNDRPTMAKVVSYLNNPLAELPYPGEPTNTMHKKILKKMVAGELNTSSTIVNEMYSSTERAQPSFLYHFCMNDNGNFTAKSSYQTNLNTLLSSLSSNTQIDSGFYNFSQGQNSDKVNAIGMCRGDVKPDACRSCLNDSRVLLTQRCPNQKEAIGWYDNCMLRYSNRSIFETMEPDPTYFLWTQNNATDMDEFNEALRSLVDSLRSKAASGDSLKKYAAGSAAGPSFQTIFALLQCTPDLSEQQCNDCLVRAISSISSCCAGKTSGRIGKPSCNLRFDTSPFYDSAADASPPSSSPPPQVPPPPPSDTNTTPSEGKSNTARIVVAVVVPIVAIVVLVISVCIFFRARKKTKNVDNESEIDDEIEPTETLQFSFDIIRMATNNFSETNMLGKGGFGPVYKVVDMRYSLTICPESHGKLSNGQEVAVKRLSMNSGQGDVEFKNEVQLVAKLQHRNLVRLLGFSLERKERLLVYEFVPNKSLDYFIFDPIKRAHLDWERRYKIIGGIARGLLYLHEDSRLRIIHRDLKASNILLDAEMNPKISDFGMARFGYMAPEYIMQGQFSVKSDVFSFGVLILEIVSGQKNSGFRHGEHTEDLISFAWKNWREGTASNLIDPTLNTGSTNEIMRCIHIGLLCVQENLADRPTMASIVLMLNSYSHTLPVPSQPAFYMHSRGLSDIQSVEYNSGAIESSKSVILKVAMCGPREGTASNIVDPTIIDGSRNEMMRCIHIALLCVQENVADRPTMASV